MTQFGRNIIDEYMVRAEIEPDGSYTAIVRIHPPRVKKLIDDFNKTHRKKYGVNGLGKIPDKLAQELAGKKKGKGHVSRRLADSLISKIPDIYNIIFSVYANSKLVDTAPFKIVLVSDHEVTQDNDVCDVVSKFWLEPQAEIGKDFKILDQEFEIPSFNIPRYVEDRIVSFAKIHPNLYNKLTDEGDPIPAEEWDMVEISIDATIDGERFDDGCEKEINVRLFRNAVVPVQLYDKLIGAITGDSLSLEIKEKEDIPPAFVKAFVDKECLRLDIKVNRVYKCENAEIDDDLSITAGYNSLEEWRTALTATANRLKESKEVSHKKVVILEYLDKNVKIDSLPDVWAEKKAKEINEAPTLDNIVKLKTIAKHTTIIKNVGAYLGVEWDDEDKSIYDRNEGSYVIKVLDHIISNSRFKYVDPETVKTDTGNREAGESSEASSD